MKEVRSDGKMYKMKDAEIKTLEERMQRQEDIEEIKGIMLQRMPYSTAMDWERSEEKKIS